MPTRRTPLAIARCIPVIVACAFLLQTPTVHAQPMVTFTVTNTYSSGAGSLFQALVNANNKPSGTSALIAFNIPKSDPGYGVNTPGVWTISPLGFPFLESGAITIDGTTQKTNQGNTNPSGPNVEIDCTRLGIHGEAFYVRSGFNTIKGLAINGAGVGIKIVGRPGYTVSNNTIQNNYIGTNATGTIARRNLTGIEINGGPTYTFVLDYVARHIIEFMCPS